MTGGFDLGALEAIVDAAGVADAIEAAMPTGGRPRQLPVRTLLVGVAAALADDRPAHLTRVLRALVGLGPQDRTRLGVEVDGHLLTYRQVERTFSSMAAAVGDGERLSGFCDAMVEASVPPEHKDATTAVAVDWTDIESWARATGGGTPAADPDASWGHRSVNTPGTKEQLFFGFYAQAVTMGGRGRRAGGARAGAAHMHACSGHRPGAGDVRHAGAYGRRRGRRGRRRRRLRLCPSHPRQVGRPPQAHRGPPRPGPAPDRPRPQGNFGGALLANGNLWCPATPSALLAISPLPRDARTGDVAAHDSLFAEALRYKLGRLSADDADGYHRVACPATAGKLRCPLKADSMSLDFDHPEVLSPPEHPPRCCTQGSITVPVEVNAKTRQKHDYPGPAFRRSYMRRTAAERSFSTLKDSATTSIRRGWCRLMGRTKNLLMLTMATVVRNLRVLAAFARRAADDAHRGAGGLPPRSRKRRRVPPLQAA